MSSLTISLGLLEPARDYLVDLLPGVGRERQLSGADGHGELQAGQDSVREVERVGDAHKDESGGGQIRPLEYGVEDFLKRGVKGKVKFCLYSLQTYLLFAQ